MEIKNPDLDAALVAESIAHQIENRVSFRIAQKRANVNTLGDLTEKTELEMMKIRNLGKKSLKEVMDKIKEMGLKFRDED